MISKTPAAKIETELKQLEEKKTSLAHELEQAEARLAAAMARRPELAELETRVFLGEASEADVDRLHQELDRDAQTAQAELDRLRRVAPEVDRRLAAGGEALRRARLDDARRDRDRALTAQVKAAEQLRDAVAQAAKAADTLARRRQTADEANAAAHELLAAGEELPEPPDEADFAAGTESLVGLIAAGPRQPSVVAAERAATRRRQDEEVLEQLALRARKGGDSGFLRQVVANYPHLAAEATELHDRRVAQALLGRGRAGQPARSA